MVRSASHLCATAGVAIATAAGLAATLTLVQSTIDVDGKRIRLSPGMNSKAQGKKGGAGSSSTC